MAANNAIASGSVILSANADGLAGGLGKANNDLKQWGHSAGGNLKTTLGSSIGGGGGIGGAISGVLTKIPGPAMVAGAALAGLGVAAHAVFGTLDDLAATNKTAGVLGVSASGYAGMQKVLERVGVEGGEVTGVLAKMGKNILDSSAAAEQFAAMGIDVSALRGADLAEQFKMIADGFTKIPRGAQQASAAMAIFGKSGAELLPVLQKGKAGINELIEGESFEILTDKQYAAAGEAVKAWKAAKKDIAGAWEGLVAHASVAFAPVVSFIGKSVSKVMNFIQPVFDWWGRAWERIGTIAEAVFTKLGEWADDFGNWLVQLGQQLDVFGGGWPTIEEAIVAVFRAAGTIGGYAFDVILKGLGNVAIGAGKVVEVFGALIGAFKDVASLMKELPDALKPAGLDGFLAGVERLGDKAGDVGKKIGAWGEENAGRRFGKGAEDFNAWLDRAIAPKPGMPGGKKLDKPVEVEAKIEPVKFAAAIERGSKEAYSIEMRSKYGEFNKPENNIHVKNGKELEKIKNVLETGTAEQRKFYEQLLAETL